MSVEEATRFPNNQSEYIIEEHVSQAHARPQAWDPGALDKQVTAEDMQQIKPVCNKLNLMWY